MLRTKIQRQAEIKPVLKKLQELRVTIDQDPGIKELFRQMQRYIQDNLKIDLYIPCHNLGIVITGVLALNENERVWVKMAPHGDTPSTPTAQDN
jgi:hypothetical protein